MKKYRAEARFKYWQMQTQVENKAIEDYKRDQHQKNLNDMNRWRTKIINIAYHTKKHMEFLEEKQKNTLKSMQLKDIANMTKTTSNQIMLDALELEHEKRWPTLATLDDKIDLDLIIPQNVLNFSEYQSKLQKLAIYAD